MALGFASAAALPGARAAAPALVCRPRTPVSASAASPGRRAALRFGALLAAGVALGGSEAAQAARSSMSGDYPADAARLLDDMKSACELGRGAPGIVEAVSKTRTEMNDFVALYRRNGKVSGSTSFNTLYTAINTLSGHYASYGNQYPVPEKRKKRLSQQFKEIDRALARGR